MFRGMCSLNIPPSLHTDILELAGKERIEFSDPFIGYLLPVDEFLHVYKNVYFLSLYALLAFALGPSKGSLLFTFQSLSN